MREMSRLTVLFAALLAFAAARPSREFNASRSLCDLDMCECYQDLHPSWTTLHCVLPSTMELNVYSFDLPTTMTELVIQGGYAISFGAGAFNRISDMRRIQVSDTRMVVFRQLTAVDISVLTLYLDIDHCNLLRFERNSFQNLRGPMSVNITECKSVSVEGDTFSWLLNMMISNVPELNLASGAFSLDPTASNVGEHGPGMTVELKNTHIAELPKSTFGSSAAKVYFSGVDIHAIRSGAFSANTYNIVIAINCSIHLIEEEAFSENSLINYLNLDSCKIQQLDSRAFRSAIADININHTRFDHVETGAINTTVAKVKILSSEFHMFMENAFELSSWNHLQMENNSFDELPPNAIVAPAASSHKLIFSNNEIETAQPKSLSFIGKAATTEIIFLNNYFGQTCHCNMSQWLSQALDVENSDEFESHSYCTVNEVLARCFNVHDLNMLLKKFLTQVCSPSVSIKCEQLKSKAEGEIEIKNPRFPHKYKNDQLTARNKKVIGIVLVSCLGFGLIAIFFSLIKWWRRGAGGGVGGGCAGIKAMFNSFHSSCMSIFTRAFNCGSNVGVDNAGSISQLSVNEYSERHRLNETRPSEIVQSNQEPSIQDEENVPTEEKFTQTLPEELTKELLDNLKERLDNPENYVEAREMIEHLYELTKITDVAPNISSGNTGNDEENIYELPYQHTTRRTNKDKKMVSTGTRVPSLDKLTPLSPYHRQTALSHEYFEPRDLAVHLYAEITNPKRTTHEDKRSVLGTMPDVIATPSLPREQYYFKSQLSPSSSSSTPSKSVSNALFSPLSSSTIKSNSSNSSSKMLNRPLPEKPLAEFHRVGVKEGPSLRLG